MQHSAELEILPRIGLNAERLARAWRAKLLLHSHNSDNPVSRAQLRICARCRLLLLQGGFGVNSFSFQLFNAKIRLPRAVLEESNTVVSCLLGNLQLWPVSKRGGMFVVGELAISHAYVDDRPLIDSTLLHRKSCANVTQWNPTHRVKTEQARTPVLSELIGTLITSGEVRRLNSYVINDGDSV